MNYAIKEIFYSIQGEGAHAGTPMVFVRFAGCNIWSGREEDRARHAQRGNCAAWCDTDFRGTDGPRGGRYSAEQLAIAVRELWPSTGTAIAVLTGGEPLLQADAELVKIFTSRDIKTHVETNGSCVVPSGVSWVTVSPKPPARVMGQHYDEVKLVLAAGIDPSEYADLATYKFIQPLWVADPVVAKRNTERAVNYVLANPGWRLSLQQHKIIEVQ